ncbi:MAG: cytochrome c oxidase subunit 3 [Hyphomicrobiales bacterium]|nr:cytochrome c oxidase subunit 3 [Hyphomicrobiales bacterium]
MASDTAHSHPYHMVEPSKWPAVGSLAALTLAVGAVMFMHDAGPWVLSAGFLLLLVTFFGWWRDVVKESRAAYHTDVVRHGLRVGMVLFIASEVMFFFAFFWAFFDRTVPFLSRTALEAWPPEGVIPLETWHLPFLNTLILLTSGATVTVAHHAVQKGDNAKTALWLLFTVILGALFTCLQAYEYGHAAFSFTDGIYSSTFYLATGFHGAHVIIGTCFLIVCMFRAKAGHFTAEKHVGFEAAAWYWHFVDVVWLFLFTCVYWWGGSGYQG